MSNVKKMEEAIKNLLEVMLFQEDEVNILVLKTMIQQYGEQCNISSLQISKQIFEEFLYNKIEDKFHKKVKKEEKIKEEEVKEEKLLMKQDTFDYYFANLIYGGDGQMNKIFYHFMFVDIWLPFVNSHKAKFPYKYQIK